jgi:maltose-binding protein MalE
MRSHPFVAAVAATAVASALLSGCSSETKTEPTSPSSTAAPATTTTTLETHTAAPGQVGVSPGGVTTAVGEDAQSTEDEYFQACHAAKVWMAAQGGDLKTQFEPYLADLQKTDSAGPGTFDKPWSQLAPDRQSAVIVAADAASDDLCG